jgi:3-oxoacyl-[acyl-carrier protein] reductase
MNQILVSGISRGVGIEIAKELLQNTDYYIIGIYRNNNDQLDKLINLYSDRLKLISYDLSVPEGIQELYLTKIKSEHPIIGLVNNAAIAYDDIVTNANINSIEMMFKVNVFSPIMLSKYIIRDMLLHKVQGTLVHISSICAHTGYKGLSFYASSKGAIEAFSKNVAREWGSVGIRSNCIVPGFMNTDMSSTLSDEQKNRIYNRNALKKEISVISVAKTTKYLLSEDSKSVTGTCIFVDNGTI